MSASSGVLRRTMLDESVTSAVPENPAHSSTPSSTAEFAREQVRGLVRRLFVPGWPRPHRQVVFSPSDIDTDVSLVCGLVAKILVDSAARVCLVEANVRASALDHIVGGTRNDGGEIPSLSAPKQKSSREISRNLFVAPSIFLLSPDRETLSMQSAQEELNELREQFDFTIIHGACAGTSSSTCLLAHLADGIVLGVTANRTRKAVAQRIQEQLAAADVRLLGIVLCERTFPIPDSLYRRL